jgi:hypothetical protein
LLAKTYQASSAALAKLGEPAAAWIAADRAMNAAERAGSPMLVAVFVFLAVRQYDQADELDVARQVVVQVDPGPLGRRCLTPSRSGC